MITEDRLLLPTSISLSCGICNQVCKRASKLLCCDAQCCWGCGVRFITKNRQCWACPNVTAETGDLVHHPQLRELVRKLSKQSDSTNTVVNGSSGQPGSISAVDIGQISKLNVSANRKVQCTVESVKESRLEETPCKSAQEEVSPYKQPMFGLFGCEVDNDASQVTGHEAGTTSDQTHVETVVLRRVSAELTKEDIDSLEEQLDEDCWSPPKDIEVATKVIDKILTRTIQNKVKESSNKEGEDKIEIDPRSSAGKFCVIPSDTPNKEVLSPKLSPSLSTCTDVVQMTEKDQRNQKPFVRTNTLPSPGAGQDVETLNKLERTSLQSGCGKNEPVKISLKDRFASLSKKITVSNSNDASAELETFHKDLKEKKPGMDDQVKVDSISSEVSASRKVKLVDKCSTENKLQEEKERIAKILETKGSEKLKSESPDKSLKSVPITNALQFLQVGLKLSKIAKTIPPTEIPFLEAEKEPEQNNENVFGFKRSRSRHASKLKLGVLHAESPPAPKEDISCSSTPKRSTRSSSKSSPADSRPNISKEERRDESSYKSRHSDPCSRSRPSDSSHRLRRRSSSRTKKAESSRLPRDERKERSSSRDRKRRSRSGDHDKRHSRAKNDKRNRSRSKEKKIKVEETKSLRHDVKDEPRERSNSVGEKRKINRKSVIQGSVVSRYLDELAHKSSEELHKEEISEPSEPHESVTVNMSNPLPKFQSFQLKDIRNRLGGTDAEPDPETELRARIANRAADKLKRQKDKVDRETEVKVISYSANLSMPVGVNKESDKELEDNYSKEDNAISYHSLPKFQSFKLRDRLNERVFSDEDSDSGKLGKPKTESEYRYRIANRTAEKLKRQREKAELDEEIQVISYSANLSMPKTRESGNVESMEAKGRNWRKNPAKREDLQAELKRVNGQVQTIKLTNELDRVNSKLTSELERAKVRVSEVEDSKEETIRAVSEERNRCTSVDLKKEQEDLEETDSEISKLSTSTNVESFLAEMRTANILDESNKVEDNVDKPKGITEEEVEEGEIVESKKGKRKKKKKHKKHKRKDESISTKVARRKSLELIKEELESVTIKVEDIRRAESKTVEEFFAEKRTVKIVPSADTSICTETETSYDDDIVNLAKDVQQLEQEVEDIKLNGRSQTRKQIRKKIKDGKKKSKTKIDDNIEIDPKIAQKIISRIISNDLGKISEDFRNAVKEEVSNTENEIKSIKQVLKKKTHKSERADKPKKKKKSKSKEKEEKKKIKEEKSELDIKIEKDDEDNGDSLDRNITLLKEQLQSLKEPSKSTGSKSNLASCESTETNSSNEEKVKRKKRKRSKSKDRKEGRKKKKSKRRREEEEEQSSSVVEPKVEKEQTPPLVPPVGRKNFVDDMPVLEDEVLLPVDSVGQTASSAPADGEIPVAQSENFDLVIGIEDNDVLEASVDAGQETEELDKDSETRDQLLDDRVKMEDDLNAVSTTVDSEAGDSNPVSEEEETPMSEESMRAMLLSQVASAWASAPVTTTTKGGEAPKLLRTKKRPANPSPTPTTVVTSVPSPPSTFISSSTAYSDQSRKIIRLKPKDKAKDKPKAVAESEVTSTTNYSNMALPRYEYCYSRTFISREEKMEFFPNLYQRFIVPLDCSSSEEDEEDEGEQSTFNKASLNQMMRKSRKSASPL